MKKDCVLIATLPSFNHMDKVFNNPMVDEVRYNTGTQTPFRVDTTMATLKKMSEEYDKKLWIDLKGRQLRITKWADPLYSCIELSHNIELLYPAKILFRNGDEVNITHVKNGNKIFVDPLPKEALGAGQSVNILAKELTIKGYLTDKDKEYIVACKMVGLNNFMASYVESFDDLAQIFRLLPTAQVISKIESLKGIEFINNYNVPNLMAAREDLFIESGQNISMMNYLKAIIERDSNAICASKIFSSLEHRNRPDFADFADLELMYNMGYRRFMLCDNVCNYSFEKAIEAWKEFINE